MSEMIVVVTRLDSGFYHVRGRGPCNWAQVPTWPCDETTLRAHMFPEACEQFVRDALALGDKSRALGLPAPKGDKT